MSASSNSHLDRFFNMRSEYVKDLDETEYPASINQWSFLLAFIVVWVSIFAGGYIAPVIEQIIGIKYWGTSINIFIISMMLIGYAVALIYYAFVLPERFQLFRYVLVLFPVLFFSLVAGSVLFAGLLVK